MLPATCPPDRMVRFVLESSPSILAHLAMNAALSAGSLAVNAAIRLAAGSRCCSKKIGRSPSVTSRSRTSLVMRHSRQTLDAASNVILLNDPRRRTSDLRNGRRHNIIGASTVLRLLDLCWRWLSSRREWRELLLFAGTAAPNPSAATSRATAVGSAPRHPSAAQ